MRLSDAIRLVRASLVAALALVAGAAAAQDWPSRPIKLVNPFPAGGTGDQVARIVFDKAGPALGVPIVIEARTGAAGMVGTDLVAKSAPDGYTFVIGSASSFGAASSTTKNMPFDPVRDFTPVVNMTNVPYLLLVHPSVPATTLAELVAFGKANPGKLSFASFGNGSSNHLGFELLRQVTGLEAVHVPYRGGAHAILALLNGEVQTSLDLYATANQYVRAGQLRLLGVAAAQRSSLMPDVPTLAEQGAPVEAGTWLAILGPAGTPAPVVQRINAEVNKALAMAEVRERLAGIGNEVAGGTPEDLARTIRTEVDKWARLVRDRKLTFD